MKTEPWAGLELYEILGTGTGDTGVAAAAVGTELAITVIEAASLLLSLGVRG